MAGVVRRVYAAGHLLFVQRRHSARSALRPRTGRLSGGPVAIASSVATGRQNPPSRGSGSRPRARSPISPGRREQQGPAHLGRPEGRAGRDGRGARGLRPVHAVARRAERGPRGPGRESGIRPLGDGRRARGGEPRDGRAGRRARPGLVSRRPFARLLGDGRREGRHRRKGLRAADPETVLDGAADEDHPEDWSRDGRPCSSFGGRPTTPRASGRSR